MVTVIRVVSGASMPKRGSGPASSVTTVPSGRVTVTTPSVPTSVVVVAPSPSVTVRLISPLSSGSTR